MLDLKDIDKSSEFYSQLSSARSLKSVNSTDVNDTFSQQIYDKLLKQQKTKAKKEGYQSEEFFADQSDQSAEDHYQPDSQPDYQLDSQPRPQEEDEDLDSDSDPMQTQFTNLNLQDDLEFDDS